LGLEILIVSKIGIQIYETRNVSKMSNFNLIAPSIKLYCYNRLCHTRCLPNSTQLDKGTCFFEKGPTRLCLLTF